MQKLLITISFVFLFLGQAVYGQVTEKHHSKYAQFYLAEALYEKEKYSAAQAEYKAFMQTIVDVNDPFYVKSKYYYARCALSLYHPNAEKLLIEFISNYPETVYKHNIYLELGRHYYQRKRYGETIAWFTKIEPLDISEALRPEYNFKLGYSYFTENELKQARNLFYEIIHIESAYQSPALYYYAHIAYLEKNYQVALESFNVLKNNPSFEKTVPYYISQIYYLQGKYEEVITYAPYASQNNDEKQNLEMLKVIGNAYYKLGKFDEAVPFLEKYNNKSATTRDEDYQLGFAYYKSGNYEYAIPMFDKVTDANDELSQIAYYHIAECYLKQEAYVSSRDAFELAARMNFDKEIEEDALYNYALLSYKIDYNPFNEAVEAMNLYLNKYPNSKHKQEMYQYLINVYSTMKNYSAAIEFMDKIANKNIQIKSAYQMMAYNYGVELFQSKVYQKAIDNFKLVAKYSIDNKITAQSLYWIAESYYKMAQYSDAIAAYRKFLEAPGGYALPMHNAAYYNIGYAYYMQEDFENAIQAFRTFTLDSNEKDKVKLTDANLRIGDAFFKKSNDEEAIKYYQKAVDLKGGQMDYARFQMGKSYGFQQDYDSKAAIMLDIVQNSPSSTFAVPALYEVAESYRLMDDNHNNQAIQYYNQVINDYPKHTLVKDAVFQIGILDFKNKRYQAAEKRFLTVLRGYQDEVKQKEALGRLKDVYSALSQPEKYLALVDEFGISFDETEKDELFFTSAYDLYQDSSWTKSIAAFQKYLTQFPRANHELESYYLMAKASLKLDRKDEAEFAYKKVIEKGNNRFTEEAALFVSEKAYEEKKYEKAVEYYLVLLSATTFAQNKLMADIGLMRSYTFLEDFEAAKPHAQKVMLDENALDFVKTEANYVISKAYIAQNDYTNAKVYLDYVVANSNAEIAAESQFYLATGLHLAEDYKDSELAVRKLIKNNGGYKYWVARALVLQAKNSIGLNDLVQAEYTLNSIINGYTIKDDGVIAEANEVMQVLIALKNKEKDIDNNSQNTIEINGGGNHD
ncbi:hypothetical protein DNU06_09390 [Putridiphycobacter roseus]|uniref:Outer membrane lipoprotein BamD-like domain-containing protein n=1 Tax=Putridiphycobacter roseus TaxID=2219161 RepID=A0A2W1MZV9_9FLAO|nr:tetratricopeptide repeat protein [Putridiphycobacter roseus]PZE16954.1 hypothetical protein DNU06_09390 [Putridiphycobacter roseus]